LGNSGLARFAEVLRNEGCASRYSSSRRRPGSSGGIARLLRWRWGVSPTASVSPCCRRASYFFFACPKKK